MRPAGEGENTVRFAWAVPTLRSLLVAFPLIASSVSAQADLRQFRIDGVVRDSISGKPVPFVIVQDAETDSSTLTDSKGHYRLTVSPGRSVLEFRKVGYRMVSVVIDADGDLTVADVSLQLLPVTLATVVVSDTAENPATRIMRQAIARKNDVLSRINDYRYDAYVKLVIRDQGKDEDSAEAVLIITETETTAYWERPGKYQEVIRARRQSSNLAAENNLVSVGEIANFNRNRIEIAQYSVVSPIADDALDHYDYFVIDTLDVAGKAVFRLAMEPKSNSAPLFVGMLDVADSTFQFLSIEVGLNDAIRIEFLRNIFYQQRFRDFGSDRWMPEEILFAGEIHFGMPLPGVPKRLGFEHRAVLENFRFDAGEVPPTVGEYLIVVDEAADDVDSSEWSERRAVPLTEVEHDAYGRIDSVENEPRSVPGKMLDGVAIAVFATTLPEFFHFNRTEGPYLGAGWTGTELAPWVTPRTKLGYAIDAKTWQYEFGADFRVSARRRAWLGAWYYDQHVWRPTLVSYSYNPTYLALLGRLDPLDYYRSKGLMLRARGKLVSFTELSLSYADVDQSSVPVVTDYSVFNVDRAQRDNPPILSGRLRSLLAELTYDSRPFVRRKGRDLKITPLTYTSVSVAAEYSSPDLFSSDFDYVRYHVRLRRKQRTFGLGMTTIDAYGGISTGALPPQRYFQVDFGKGLFYEEGGFNTLNETNFTGNRVGLVWLSHNFDRLLFKKSGLPLVRDIPFTLYVHGAAFWTDFSNHTSNPGDEFLITAPRAYTEAGFGIGNITPFLSPLNFAVYFSWQLSSYDTRGFEFRIGIPSP